MDFSLTEDQRQLRDRMAKFAQLELNSGAIERDRDQVFPHDLWKRCGEMGLQGLPVPPEYGGEGLDPLSTAIALEGFGYGCRDAGLLFAVCAHLLACVVPISLHGSGAVKKKYLPGLCNGTLIAVNGMTEETSGSDAFHMASRAAADGDGYRISGVKTLATNAPIANLAVIYAVTDEKKGAHGGITGFVVETNTPGLRQGQRFDKLGFRTAQMGRLDFKDVVVPKENVLGGAGGGSTIFTQSMEWERICIAACHVGAMQHLMERAIEYARTRTAQGSPIGKYQAVSHKIADMKIRLETARLLVYHAASRIGKARDNAMNASMVKVYASECLQKTAMDTIQIFGGHGILTENELERALRDSIGSSIYSGTNEVQRNIIASWLGL
ncbi:MAG: acyl-CoA dehydrogenase family protein [Candidatus Hydrogenedentes bacterium]|nr:acyl-CoA dehydrogenase family protein [Candidatus Hydrogenedentota bacterium]